MRVAEFGCGEKGGPFFDGATEHYAIDIVPGLVEASVNRDTRLTPMVADFTELVNLGDSSVDIVLARNVFGDPLLGVSPDKRWDPFTQLNSEEITHQAKQKKVSMLREASRLLTRGGILVMVEEYSPLVTEKFIIDIDTGELSKPDDLTSPARTTLEQVSPTNYASSFERRPKAWVSYKI